MLEAVDNTTEVRLDLLTELVQTRHKYLAEAAETGDRSHKRLLKRLARRRAVEAQSLVGELLSLTDSWEIRKAVDKGITREN